MSRYWPSRQIPINRTTDSPKIIPNQAGKQYFFCLLHNLHDLKASPTSNQSSSCGFMSHRVGCGLLCKYVNFIIFIFWCIPTNMLAYTVKIRRSRKEISNSFFGLLHVQWSKVLGGGGGLGGSYRNTRNTHMYSCITSEKPISSPVSFFRKAQSCANSIKENNFLANQNSSNTYKGILHKKAPSVGKLQALLPFSCGTLHTDKTRIHIHTFI